MSRQRAAGHRVTRAEIDLEATYLAQVERWLSAQLDVQYIVDPSTAPQIGDALVVTTRIQVAL